MTDRTHPDSTEPKAVSIELPPLYVVNRIYLDFNGGYPPIETAAVTESSALARESILLSRIAELTAERDHARTCHGEARLALAEMERERMAISGSLDSSNMHLKIASDTVLLVRSQRDAAYKLLESHGINIDGDEDDE